MLKKYFAWIDRAGWWCGQKLVDVRVIPALRKSLGSLPNFATVQTYDDGGKVLYCPLYADFDCKADPAKSLADARYVVYLLGEMSNVTPDIYYSGGKGFHIIMPFKLEGELGHLVAKHFFEHLASDLPTLDRSVYRTQAMLRLPNSPGSRPGKYKVQLTRHELMTLSMSEIEELGSRPRRPFSEWDESQINDEFLSLVTAGYKALPKNTIMLPVDSDEPMTPCLSVMLTTAPMEGERNQTAVLLARAFRIRGVPESETLSLILAHHHWAEIDKTERGMVTKAVRSVYHSRRESRVGCKVGRDAHLMQKFCDPFCWFNEKPTEFRLGKSAG